MLPDFRFGGHIFPDSEKKLWDKKNNSYFRDLIKIIP